MSPAARTSPRSKQQTSIPQSEALSSMTAAAIFKIQIAAEGALAGVTSRAGVISSGEVFQSSRRADLSLLRQSRGVAVTVRATETLARAVLRVTESEAECG